MMESRFMCQISPPLMQDFVCHWSSRANEMTHPILKARYADLVWDAGPAITGERSAMPFDPGIFSPT
jgi:hypothetical protein